MSEGVRVANVGQGRNMPTQHRHMTGVSVEGTRPLAVVVDLVCML